jgi:chromosome segregation ATPase
MNSEDSIDGEKKSGSRFRIKADKLDNEKPEKKDLDPEESAKLMAQMKDLENRLNTFVQQLTDIIIPEEESADQVYQVKEMEYEKVRTELQKLDLERNLAKARWDDARNKIKTFSKQIRNYRNDINKIRKKLNQPLLMDPDEDNKGYKVFDRLKPRDEKEKDEKEKET